MNWLFTSTKRVIHHDIVNIVIFLAQQAIEQKVQVLFVILMRSKLLKEILCEASFLFIRAQESSNHQAITLQAALG